jgi:hypothetical protein
MFFLYIHLATLNSLGIMLEVQYECFNEFPYQCVGCSEYREYRQDLAEQLLWLTNAGFYYPYNRIKIVKECKAFHKRIVEYQK